MKKSHTVKSAEQSAVLSREERRRIRRRRRFVRRAVVIAVALLVVAAVVFSFIEVAKALRGQTTSFLGVKAIEVECVDGTVRYSNEEIIVASGIYLNQSLLGLNKVQASQRVLEKFPYLNYVEVKNTSFSTVCIRVAETKVLAAVQAGDQWLIVGENNHVLERVTEENLPSGVVRVVGATMLSTDLRADALDERRLGVCTTLVQAFAASGLTKDITTIDVTEQTNLHLLWKDRLDIVLGNESNMVGQVAAFKEILPTLIKNNGENITGRLDMSSYSDDNDGNDRAVFTPADELRPSTTTGDVTADSTTAAGAVGSGTTTAGTAMGTTGSTVTGSTTAAAA